MKFDTLKLIYLHPSRTGGAQIENIICGSIGIRKGPADQPDMDLMFGFHAGQYGNLQHLTFAEIACLALADLTNYSILCSIRNPISKFVSAYFYNKCDQKHARPGNFLARLSVQPMRHFLPQTQYTHRNGTAIYSHLIRQEHYRQDLEKFCDTYGFQCIVQEKFNTSGNPTYNPYKDRNEIDLFHCFFTREERQLFYSLYQEDFRLLYPDYVDIVENML